MRARSCATRDRDRRGQEEDNGDRAELEIILNTAGLVIEIEMLIEIERSASSRTPEPRRATGLPGCR